MAGYLNKVMYELAGCKAEDEAEARGEVATEATKLPDGARLLETLLYSPSPGFFLLEEHLRRVLASAAELGWSVAAAARSPILAALDREAKAWSDDEAGRVRVLLARDGCVTVERVALPLGSHPLIELLPAPESVVRAVVLDCAATLRNDLTLRHKCTHRPCYDAARARTGVGSEYFDVLMFNEDEELTECSIANVALEVGDGLWRTPPLKCGLLGGVMRAALLRAGSGGGDVSVSPEAWQLEEGVVTLKDLRAALRDGRRLVAFNSVRGAYWLRVVLV